MRRCVYAAALAAAAGCATGPFIDNPAYVQPDLNEVVNNPCLVAPDAGGPDAYAKVFEACLDTLDDYYDIAIANRYDGRVETHPRVSPGVEQFFKPGTPDLRQRVLNFTQSCRTRAVVLIEPAPENGYFVKLTVFRELEDVAKPTRATAGQATFRNDPTVERQFDVVDDSTPTTSWIPAGRDPALEQAILCRIRDRAR